jgi:hypothetical protein
MAKFFGFAKNGFQQTAVVALGRQGNADFNQALELACFIGWGGCWRFQASLIDQSPPSLFYAAIMSGSICRSGKWYPSFYVKTIKAHPEQKIASREFPANSVPFTSFPG